MEEDWMTFFEREARNYAAELNCTPPPPSGSSETSFQTAEEFHTPASHASSDWAGFSPGTREMPLVVDSASSADTTPARETDQPAIPPPPTCSDDGRPLQWNSWDAAFDYLLAFSKEHQFCVKKGTNRKKNGRKVAHYILCVKGGQRNYIKVSTPQRQRQSASIIGDEPYPWKAYLRAPEEGDPITLDLVHSTHNHGPAGRWTIYTRHRREDRKASANLLSAIRTDFDSSIEPKRSWHSLAKLYPETTITLPDLRNERAKIRALLNEGLPAVQALLRGLGDEFAHQIVLDENNRLVHLLFFHYTALQNLCRWPYTFQLDVTYNTERLGLKLLQIVGMTSENESFIIG